MNVDKYGVNIHHEIDRKSRFRYYLRVFFDLMDSVVVNAHVIYKKKVNAGMSLLNFTVTLAGSLINRFSSQKPKFTAEQLKLNLLLPYRNPRENQNTEKWRRCLYCFNYGKKDTKCFTYCESCNVSLCVQKDRNCFKL